MENSTYKRKTSNPKMAWSEERRAEFSAQCKKAHADGTWHKKSKKAVSKAISNGKKEAIKFKNRSMAQKKSWAKRKQKEADFFSTGNVSKRLNSRRGKEPKEVPRAPQEVPRKPKEITSGFQHNDVLSGLLRDCLAHY